MKIVVFEDQQVSCLYPITIGRPAYSITCGSYRLVDWLRLLGHPLIGVVRPHLTEIQLLDFEDLQSPWATSSDEPWLLVNARLVPSASAFAALTNIIEQGEACRVACDGILSVALAPPPHDPVLECADSTAWAEVTGSLRVDELPARDAPLPLLAYPHDVIRYNSEILPENLAHRLKHGQYREVADGVFAGPGSVIGEHLVSVTQNGPIVVDENAVIGPHCYINGPVYLGENSRVSEQAAIKCGVTLGHTGKLGGEVAGSIIEPYSNKQHYGYLGNSYLGSWVNLGAGTSNSDLKNTYGVVRMEIGGQKVDTGMQFVGCFIGDYTKSAINTGIFTGRTIGVCSMLYGFVTSNVPSFANYARQFGQVTEIPPEIMITTQGRTFQRRGKPHRPCDQQLIRDMFELTGHDRQLPKEPLAF